MSESSSNALPTEPTIEMVYAMIPDQFKDAARASVGMRLAISDEEPVISANGQKIELMTSDSMPYGCEVRDLSSYTDEQIASGDLPDDDGVYVEAGAGFLVEVQRTMTWNDDGPYNDEFQIEDKWVERSYDLDFVLVRVVDDLNAAPDLLLRISRNAKARLSHEVKPGCCFPSFTDPSVEELVRATNHPVANRIFTMLAAHAEAAKTLGRSILQDQLTEVGLGRINGVDPKAFAGLTDVDLLEVFSAVRDAYPGAPLFGALHYTSKKGTDPQVLDREIEGILEDRSWDREVLELRLAWRKGPELTLESFLDWNANAEERVLEAFDKADEAGRQLSMTIGRVDDPNAGERCGTEAVLERLAQAAQRPLAEVLADTSAAPRELCGALEVARRNGMAYDDQLAVEAYTRLTPTKGYRVVPIRQVGPIQCWYAGLLKIAEGRS